MKKRVPILLSAALLLTGCQGGESSAGKPVPADGIALNSSDSVPAEYAETVKAYFTAIEQKDYAAYSDLMHPVYREAYGAFLQNKGSSLEANFASQRKRLDEDGYDSWRITDITLDLYPNPDYDYFFTRFTEAGILTDDQVKAVRDSAEEMQDLQFTVNVLYEGDEEPVPTISGMELILFKTADGIKLFG